MSNLQKLIENGGRIEIHTQYEDHKLPIGVRGVDYITVRKPITSIAGFDTEKEKLAKIAALIEEPNYNDLDAFLSDYLGNPDDVFDKHHLDVGELQAMFCAWHIKLLQQAEKIAGE